MFDYICQYNYLLSITLKFVWSYYNAFNNLCILYNVAFLLKTKVEKKRYRTSLKG